MVYSCNRVKHVSSHPVGLIPPATEPVIVCHVIRMALSDGSARSQGVHKCMHEAVNYASESESWRDDETELIHSILLPYTYEASIEPHARLEASSTQSMGADPPSLFDFVSTSNTLGLNAVNTVVHWTDSVDHSIYAFACSAQPRDTLN